MILDQEDMSQAQLVPASSSKSQEGASRAGGWGSSCWEMRLAWSRLSAPLPTTTHHFPHLTKSCSPWSPSSASFLTPAVSNSLDHPFLRILASLAQQSGEASAQQQGPSDHFLASSLSMDCRGTEGKGLLLQQSQQPRTVLGRARPGLRHSALSPRGRCPQLYWVSGMAV